MIKTQPVFTPEVEAYCSSLGVLDYVPVALEIAERCFPSLREMSLSEETTRKPAKSGWRLMSSLPERRTKR